MSDSSDEQDDQQTKSPEDESEQPVDTEAHPEQSQGGQPQNGQPQGGQPQSGQPQGGQPQSGQPQGGYQPQQPVQTGPKVSDIFSRHDTTERMKIHLVLLSSVGVGLLVGAVLGGFISYAQGVTVAQGAFILGPPAAALFAFRDADILSGVPNNLVYATSAVTGAAGTMILVIFGMFGGIMAASLAGQQTTTIGGQTVTIGQISFPAGDFFLVGIMVAIGAAVTAVLVVWAKRNFLAPSRRHQAP